MTRAMGRANAATSITTPKKARSAPTATTWIRRASCVASIWKPSHERADARKRDEHADQRHAGVTAPTRRAAAR